MTVRAFDQRTLSDLGKELLATSTFRQAKNKKQEEYQAYPHTFWATFSDGHSIPIRIGHRQYLDEKKYGDLHKWRGNLEEAVDKFPSLCGGEEKDTKNIRHKLAPRNSDSAYRRVVGDAKAASRAAGKSQNGVRLLSASSKFSYGLAADNKDLFWLSKKDADDTTWRLMRVSKAGGDTHLVAAFADSAELNLIGLDKSHFFLQENFGGMCEPLWQIERSSGKGELIAIWSADATIADDYLYYCDFRNLQRWSKKERRSDAVVEFGHCSYWTLALAAEGQDVYWLELEEKPGIRHANGINAKKTNTVADINLSPRESGIYLDGEWLFFNRRDPKSNNVDIYRISRKGGSEETVISTGFDGVWHITVNNKRICWVAGVDWKKGKGPHGTDLPSVEKGIFCADTGGKRTKQITNKVDSVMSLVMDEKNVYWLDSGIVAKASLTDV